MTQRSTVGATEVARLLWARAAGDASAPDDVAAASERLCAQLRRGLGRWVGATGYTALLDRAVHLARSEHPALGSLSCHGGEEQVVSAAVRDHGAREVEAGMVAAVAGLIDLLGRIIGEEMALRLVEQTGGAEKIVKPRPSARSVQSIESKGSRNGRAN